MVYQRPYNANIKLNMFSSMQKRTYGFSHQIFNHLKFVNEAFQNKIDSFFCLHILTSRQLIIKLLCQQTSFFCLQKHLQFQKKNRPRLMYQFLKWERNMLEVSVAQLHIPSHQSVLSKVISENAYHK